METQELKRAISMPQLVFYGLGTMIGGGIYALTGKVAGIAGMYAPISFVFSALLALLSALSYAELSTRFPQSAGAAQYVQAAFSRRAFSLVIAVMLVFTGIVSAAALVNATAGFIYDLTGFSRPLIVIALLLALGGIAAWGVAESVFVAVAITCIEIGGLLMVIAASGDAFSQVVPRIGELVPPMNDMAVWGAIMGGAFLAFYAFVGFEDLVNMAEEVKDVEQTMPWTIIICVLATMVIYMLIVLAAILTVPPEQLSQTNTPMAAIVEGGKSGIPPQTLTYVSMLATVNGALVQIVMGARVIYGMSRGHARMKFLAAVHAGRQTPVNATLVITAITLVFALLLNLESLAKIASAVILMIFVCVNASLLTIKLKEKSREGFRVPLWVPVIGLLSSLALLAYQLNKYI